MSILAHEALIALPSLPGDWPNEIILLDSKWLAFHRSLNGPITIAKTKFVVAIGCEWRAIIIDGSTNLVLASSDDIDTEDCSIDLISVIGHRILLMPWQSLIVQFDGQAVDQGACFIENTKQEQ